MVLRGENKTTSCRIGQMDQLQLANAIVAENSETKLLDQWT